MKLLAAIAVLLTSSPAYACMYEGDIAKAPNGQNGEVTYAHCDIDGFEAYEITFKDGLVKLFEAGPEDQAPMEMPVLVTDMSQHWHPIDELPD